MANKPMDDIERGFGLINRGLREAAGPNNGLTKQELEFIRDMSQKINEMAVKVLERNPSKKGE